MKLEDLVLTSLSYAECSKFDSELVKMKTVLVLRLLGLAVLAVGVQAVAQVATEAQLNSATESYQSKTSNVAIVADITLSHYVQVLERSMVIEGNGFTVSGNKSTRCFYLRGSVNDTVMMISYTQQVPNPCLIRAHTQQR